MMHVRVQNGPMQWVFDLWTGEERSKEPNKWQPELMLRSPDNASIPIYGQIKGTSGGGTLFRGNNKVYPILLNVTVIFDRVACN